MTPKSTGRKKVWTGWVAADHKPDFMMCFRYGEFEVRSVITKKKENWFPVKKIRITVEEL